MDVMHHKVNEHNFALKYPTMH